MTDKMSARDERFYDAGLEFGIAKVASLETRLALVRNTTDWQAEKLRHLRGVLQDIELIAEELGEQVLMSEHHEKLARLIAGKAQAARAASRVPTTTEMRDWAEGESQQRAQNATEGRGR